MALSRKEWGIIEGLVRRRLNGEITRAEKKRQYLSDDSISEITERITELQDLMEKVRREKNSAKNTPSKPFTTV